MRRLAVVAVVAVALLGGGAFAVSRLTAVHVPFLSDTCRVFLGDAVVRVEPTQLTHAATITAVAARRGLPERAVTIALATALQESKLQNLPSGDRDSLGLFQQRPSQGWGTPVQLRDPRYAAAAFFDHLVKVRGWQSMRLTDAAQAVQRSGHPELYQKWEQQAATMAAALLGREAGAVTCQLRQDQPPRYAGTKALTGEVALDLGALRVTTRDEDGTPALDVAIGSGSAPATGWRTAHWFVAKAQEYGVRRVAFAGTVWTSESGKWARNASAPDAERVEVRMAAA